MSVYILFLSRIIASFRFNVEECHISIFINIWLYRLIDLIVIMININMIDIIIALYAVSCSRIKRGCLIVYLQFIFENLFQVIK